MSNISLLQFRPHPLLQFRRESSGTINLPMRYLETMIIHQMRLLRDMLLFVKSVSHTMALLRRACGQIPVSFGFPHLSSILSHDYCFHKEYVCPKCNHFNASANAKKQRQRSPSASPQSTPQQQRLPTPNGSPRDVGGADTVSAADASMMEIDDS